MDRRALDFVAAEPGFSDRDIDGAPLSCVGCPFAGGVAWWQATTSGGEIRQRVVCSMLGRLLVWATDPECSMADWRARARAELDPPRRRPIPPGMREAVARSVVAV